MADNIDTLVSTITDIQTSLDRIIASQEAFQRDVISLLREISASITSLAMDTSLLDTIGPMAQDISVIANRYRVPDYEDD